MTYNEIANAIKARIVDLASQVEYLDSNMHQEIDDFGRGYAHGRAAAKESEIMALEVLLERMER